MALKWFWSFNLYLTTQNNYSYYIFGTSFNKISTSILISYLLVFFSPWLLASRFWMPNPLIKTSKTCYKTFYTFLEMQHVIKHHLNAIKTLTIKYTINITLWAQLVWHQHVYLQSIFWILHITSLSSGTPCKKGLNYITYIGKNEHKQNVKSHILLLFIWNSKLCTNHVT